MGVWSDITQWMISFAVFLVKHLYGWHFNSLSCQANANGRLIEANGIIWRHSRLSTVFDRFYLTEKKNRNPATYVGFPTYVSVGHVLSFFVHFSVRSKRVYMKTFFIFCCYPLCVGGRGGGSVFRWGQSNITVCFSDTLCIPYFLYLITCPLSFLSILYLLIHLFSVSLTKLR